MFKLFHISSIAIAFVLLTQASVVLGQESAIDVERIRAICEKVASTYQLESAKGGRRFELVDKSRLEWSKNTNEGVYGNVFIWTDQGAPAAVASIFKFVRPKDDLDSEFHSLSVKPIQAKVGSTVVWKPSVGGITYHPLTGVPEVAVRKPLRLAQMRSMARQFRADRENPDGDVTQLRFLSTPIIVYESEAKGVLSGAIYAFVDQTDPEVLLIIEARESDAGERSWNYAVARMNTQRLGVYHRDKVIYRADHYEKLEDRSSAYTLFQRLQDDPEFDVE